jgi:hypothetical protein
MKQIVVLEQAEIEKLQQGNTLTLLTPGGGEMGLQFLRVETNGNGHRLVCDICGERGGVTGPFKNAASLAAHRRWHHERRHKRT